MDLNSFSHSQNNQVTCEGFVSSGYSTHVNRSYKMLTTILFLMKLPSIAPLSLPCHCSRAFLGTVRPDVVSLYDECTTVVVRSDPPPDVPSIIFPRPLLPQLSSLVVDTHHSGEADLAKSAPFPAVRQATIFASATASAS